MISLSDTGADTASDTSGPVAVDTTGRDGFEPVESIGEVPSAFTELVKENRFANASYSGGRIYGATPLYGMKLKKLKKYLLRTLMLTL